MPKKIFITRVIPDAAIVMLREKGYLVDIYDKDEILPKQALMKILADNSYDAVICLLTDTIDRDVYESAPSVTHYASYTTGFDYIDIALAKEKGIVVSNAPAPISAKAVAEHTIALMFALGKRIVEGDTFVRTGSFTGWSPMQFIGTDFAGKTLALVGSGHIGERVATIAYALGLTIVYTDIVHNAHIETSCNGVYYASLDEMLPVADMVSLHVPLLDSTHHLIDARRLALMRASGFLINTSRGGVIDEKALVQALKDKQIRGAALDVFEYEPQISAGLCALSNVILTPHIASASISAREQMGHIAAQNIIDHFEGRTPLYIVNP